MTDDYFVTQETFQTSCSGSPGRIQILGGVSRVI